MSLHNLRANNILISQHGHFVSFHILFCHKKYLMVVLHQICYTEVLS